MMWTELLASPEGRAIIVLVGISLTLLALFLFGFWVIDGWKPFMSHETMDRIARRKMARFKKKGWINISGDHFHAKDTRIVNGLRAGDTVRCFATSCGCIGGKRKLKDHRDGGVRHTWNGMRIGGWSRWGLDTGYDVMYKPRKGQK